MSEPSIGAYHSESFCDERLIDEHYMARAFTLAQRGVGHVSPNPAVGCVLVNSGRVVGEGYHERFGGSHAEVNAIKKAGEHCRDAVAYVTLEPCTALYAGKKTPSCTDALIRAGVKRVVIAVRDPNPQVNGEGIAQLKSAGIAVIEGVLAEQGARLIRGFAKWIITKRPFLILKAARTSDDYAAASLDGNWFTSNESRRRVHQLRAEVDSVMVGRKTAAADNPKLTVREVEGKNPYRVVLDTYLRLPDSLNLFTDGVSSTLLFTAVGESGITPWGERIKVASSEAGVELGQVLDILGGRGITSLLVEGGPTLHREFIRTRLVDEAVLFTAAVRADYEVKQRPELRNGLTIPKSWHILGKDDSDGDIVVVAQPKPLTMSRNGV